MYVLKYGDFPESIKLFETEVPLPSPPNKKSDIFGYNLPQNKQKFYKTDLPDFWQPEFIINEAESRFREGKNINYDWWRKNSTLEMERFSEQEWEKRVNGFWFYNNGVPTYITGLNYFYINWYQLDFGFPDFRDRDRRFWLMWNHIENDPRSYGMIYTKNRRDGATARGGCIQVDFATKYEDVFTGIQNKNGQDALELFKNVVVRPFQRLPFFFKPISKGTDDPQNGLFFSHPPRRITINKSNILSDLNEDALNSSITWKRTVFNAYDGKKLYRFFVDESAKMEEADLLKLWAVVKPTLKLEKTGEVKVGSRIGKAYVPTTVEDIMGRPGQRFQKLWLDSDPTTKDKFGFTASGLTRYFVDSADGYAADIEDYFDEFGNSMFDEAADYIESRAESYIKRGDIIGLQEWRRQNPRHWEQAFQGVGSSNILDIQRLSDLKNHLESHDFTGRPNVDNLVTRGNLIWTNDSQTGKRSVEFRQDKGGRFFFNFATLDKYTRNNTEIRGDLRGVPQYFPKNKDKGVIGIDPIQYNLDDLVSNYHSKGSALGMTFYDPDLDRDKPGNFEEGGRDFAKDWLSYSFFVEYMDRPVKAADFYEDMIKLAHFTGMPCMIERQTYGLIQHFQDVGYGNFLMVKPIKDQTTKLSGKGSGGAGSYASVLMHETAIEKWQSFVCDHAYPHRLPFLRTINQLLQFDGENITKLDLFAAGEQCLLGANRWQIKAYKNHAEADKTVFEIPKYTIRNGRSTRNG